MVQKSRNILSKHLNSSGYLLVSMATKQINIKLQKNLYDAASSFAENYGYRNIQELAADSLREKIFEKNNFDESFSEKEIGLIDSVIEKSIKKRKLTDANQYFKEFK